MRRTKQALFGVGPARLVVVITLMLAACERPRTVIALDLGPTTDFLDPSLPDAREPSQLEPNCMSDEECKPGERCSLFDIDAGLCLPTAPCTTDADCRVGAFCHLPDYLCRPPGRCWVRIPNPILPGIRLCDCAGRLQGNPWLAARAGASVAWFGYCDASALPCFDEYDDSIASDLLKAVRQAARGCQSDADCWPVVELGDCCRVAISANALPGALEHLRRARELLSSRCACGVLTETIASEWSNYPPSLCSARGVCEEGRCL